MKKTILSVMLIAFSLAAFAQPATTETPKPVTPVPKHEEYKFDGAKPLTLTFSITMNAGQVNDYLYTTGQGGPSALDFSQQLSALQATQLKNSYKAVNDTLANHVQRGFQKFVEADKAKFTADTTAKYHPKIKK